MKRLLTILFVLALVPAAFAQSYSTIPSGAQVVPGPGDPDGTGFGVVTIDGTTLRTTIFAQNIGTPTAAEIRSGAAGTSGAVVVTLTPGTLSNGSTTITTEVANQINANPGGYYIELRNAEFPNGAIRGQLTRAQGDGVRSAFLPVVGKVAGQAGTNFVTDMRIVNNGGATATVTLDFYGQNAAGNNAATATKTVTVAPGEQKVLNDVMQSTLNVANGLGGLKITSDQNVLVTARVINDLRGESKGTAGFAYDARETGSTSGTLAFLSNNADYRTNIGYFNPGSSPVTATFVARRADGAVLGTNTVTIPGFAMVQQAAFALISNVAEANRTQNDFFVTWSATSPLFVYGAVTDNKTGDAVLTR
ncbi:MAG: CHRD domain-containing protein [Acidobacteria bacterium]|nr:CHRD domain-containing protein [Acidobacteriota bacterium]